MLIAVDGTGDRCVSSCGTSANLDVLTCIRLYRVPVIKSAVPLLQSTVPRWTSITSAQDFAKARSDDGAENMDCVERKIGLFYQTEEPDTPRQKTVRRHDKHQWRLYPYSSRVARNVAEHKRSHTGERPFSCRFCHRAFAQKVNLQTHERIHTGERPFKCSTCGSVFARKSSLKDHERTHTGERPYGCEVCGRTFGQRGTLISHRRRHDL